MNGYYIVEPVLGSQRELILKRSAGNKARADIEELAGRTGLCPITIPLEEDADLSLLDKIIGHYTRTKKWSDALGELSPATVVLIQMPIRNHSIFLAGFLKKLRAGGVLTIALVHDLEMLRDSEIHLSSFHRMRVKLEEANVLNSVSAIIAHNSCMAEALVRDYSISESRIVSLGLFDYLCDSDCRAIVQQDLPIVIAGNLDRQKAGYVYSLPNDVRFNLYGVNYTGSTTIANIDYSGSYDSEMLPSKLRGSYGLIWDGPVTETCAGAYGNYLRVNNPHKTSLYLASGLPVVAWDKAAIAKYVLENNVGITVSSLNDLRNSLDKVSLADYIEMRRNAEIVAKRLKTGGFTDAAIEEACRISKNSLR